jgi:hypothetical protein
MLLPDPNKQALFNPADVQYPLPKAATVSEKATAVQLQGVKTPTLVPHASVINTPCVLKTGVYLSRNFLQIQLRVRENLHTTMVDTYAQPPPTLS